MSSNPAASKSLEFKWRRVERSAHHIVSNEFQAVQHWPSGFLGYQKIKKLK